MGHCLIVKGHRTHRFYQSTIHGGGGLNFQILFYFWYYNFFLLGNEDATDIIWYHTKSKLIYLVVEWNPTDPPHNKDPTYSAGGGSIPPLWQPPFFSLRRAALYGSGGVRASRGSAYYLVEELENASGIPTHINLGHQTTTRSQKSCNLSQVDIVSPPGSDHHPGNDWSSIFFFTQIDIL